MKRKWWGYNYKRITNINEKITLGLELQTSTFDSIIISKGLGYGRV